MDNSRKQLQPNRVGFNLSGMKKFDRQLTDGMPGIKETLRAMIAVTCMATKTSTTHRLARQLAKPETGSTQIRRVREPVTFLIKLMDFVLSRVEYTPDPPDIELVQTPERTLKRGRGDCDDFSVLIASIAKALKLPVRFIVARTSAHRFFHHVYPEIQIGSVWVPMDATLTDPRPGKHPPGIADKLVYGLSCP